MTDSSLEDIISQILVDHYEPSQECYATSATLAVVSGFKEWLSEAAGVDLDKLLSGEMVAVYRTGRVKAPFNDFPKAEEPERDFAQEALDKLAERLADNAGKVTDP